MKRILTTVGASLLALIFGLASCNKADSGVSLPEEKGNTYVAVSLSFPAETRALPEDYNKVGTWDGKDHIEKVAIFVVGDGVVSTGQYEVEDFNPLTGGVLKPKKAIKTTKGMKKIYALVNGTADIIKKLSLSDAAAFEQAFTNEVIKLENSKADKVNVFTSASKIAKYDDTKGDIIVMTNSESATLNVEDNVKEAQAIAGTKNIAHVKVARAAARVIVTTKSKTYEVKRPITGEKIGTISDVKWVLAREKTLSTFKEKVLPTSKLPSLTTSPMLLTTILKAMLAMTTPASGKDIKRSAPRKSAELRCPNWPHTFLMIWVR